jgi:hypothetical protein
MTTTKTADEIKGILSKHLAWIRGERDGIRANLSGADLSGADLSGANLSGANLSGANLSEADLYGASLYGANLSEADLYGANLSGASLSRANLSRASLYGANLSRANLSGANLSEADLYGANLSRANLSEASLYGANLSGASLDLDKMPADVQARWRILPDDGVVIGWKKCRDNVLVCLEIPTDARRSNAPGGRKCRAEAALVVGIYAPDGSLLDRAEALHDGSEYRTGETRTVPNFDDNPLNECAPGIHFYITRAEAEAHS